MLETFTHIPLFRGLERDQITQLDPLFEHLAYTSNSIIFAQDQPADHLYILLKGTVTIEYKPYDGPPITISHLRSGDVFGWSAVVGSRQYTSASTATSPVEATRVLATDFWEFVRKHPETGAFILSKIANGVSTRWKNAHIQVQAILEQSLLEANRK